jgi:hypothetical protein
MNCVEHGPEHVAFELERAHGFALKLGRVAIFQGNRERFVRIAPCLRDAASKIIKSASINPPIEFFEGRKAGTHQIWRKKLCQRRRNGDRPRLTAREIHVSINRESNPRQ